MGGGPVSCPSCGHQNPAGARFCNECGASLAAPTITLEPRSYTPRHLVEKILASRSALRGERKLVTVLFADVARSMELAERVDPEEWHRLLDRLFQVLAGGVHRYEGTINQYTGDGIMALFGAPIAHEDHAQRACAAALDLARDLGALADDVRRESGLELAVRMGLNSGEVVVGRIGDDLRMDYTAQGHVVGIAARVQQLAPPGGVAVTGETARLATGFFDFVDRGEQSMKGASVPVRVFELKGPGRIRSRLESSRARGFSRFVGREQEVRRLRGDLPGALAQGRRAVELAEERGSAFSRVEAAALLGAAELAAGDLPAATSGLERALALARTRRAALWYEPRILATLADARRAAGDRAGARALVAEARELVDQRRGWRLGAFDVALAWVRLLASAPAPDRGAIESALESMDALAAELDSDPCRRVAALERLRLAT
jgi:class 3 adenylate cyclase